MQSNYKNTLCEIRFEVRSQALPRLHPPLPRQSDGGEFRRKSILPEAYLRADISLADWSPERSESELLRPAVWRGEPSFIGEIC